MPQFRDVTTHFYVTPIYAPQLLQPPFFSLQLDSVQANRIRRGVFNICSCVFGGFAVSAAECGVLQVSNDTQKYYLHYFFSLLLDEAKSAVIIAIIL